MSNVYRSQTLESQLSHCFNNAQKAFAVNGNGAYPFEEYMFLYDLVYMYRPRRILELGTGYGVSTYALGFGLQTIDMIENNVPLLSSHNQIPHLTEENSQIYLLETVDKNSKVQEYAYSRIQDAEIGQYVQFYQQLFMDFLGDRADGLYDMVFFDGFAPGLRVFLELERVLRAGGVMVCGNLNLRGDVRKITQRMKTPEYYTQAYMHTDTYVGIKATADH